MGTCPCTEGVRSEHGHSVLLWVLVAPCVMQMPLKQSYHGTASNENAKADNCQIPSSIIMELKSPLLELPFFFFF